MAKPPILPPEIISELFAALSHGNGLFGDRKQKALWKLATVSRSWYHIARPFLFSDLKLTFEAYGKHSIEAASTHLHNLLSLIAHSPDIPLFVRQLELTSYTGYPGEKIFLGDTDGSNLFLELVLKLEQLTSFQADIRVNGGRQEYDAWWSTAITPTARRALAHVCRLPSLRRLESDAVIPLSIYIHHPNLRYLRYNGDEVIPDVDQGRSDADISLERHAVEALPMLTVLRMDSNNQFRGRTPVTINAYMLQNHPQVFTHLTELRYATVEDIDTDLLPQILRLTRDTLTSFSLYSTIEAPAIDLKPLANLCHVSLSYEITVMEHGGAQEGAQLPTDLAGPETGANEHTETVSPGVSDDEATNTFNAVLATLNTLPWQNIETFSLNVDGWVYRDNWNPVPHWHDLDKLVAAIAPPTIQDVEIAMTFEVGNSPSLRLLAAQYLYDGPYNLAPWLHERHKAGTIASLKCSFDTWIDYG